MKQRILSTIFVLIAFVGITRSQTLSVEPLSLPAGAEGEIVVGLNGATTMTALQFCISIPNGYELNSLGEGFGAVLGNATRGGHTVNMQQVGDRNYLVVVYSMHLNTFANGELVKIPVVASGEAGTATGSLYNIRMANKDEKLVTLDEYVESNNNKNKYTNFNLVLRKSIRENWFTKNKYKKEVEVPNWFNKEIKNEMSEESKRIYEELTRNSK